MTFVKLGAGHVIVFEGLDKAGKTTQLDLLRANVDPQTAMFAHMPTGFTTMTRITRQLLEEPSIRPTNDLSTQLFHLACHAESVPLLQAALGDTAVVLDRWWWSTIAYGWYGGTLSELGLPLRTWIDLASTVWGNITPAVVLLFEQPYEYDNNNRDGVAHGYRNLADDSSLDVTVVPQGTAEEVNEFIVNHLVDRGIASVG